MKHLRNLFRSLSGMSKVVVFFSAAVVMFGSVIGSGTADAGFYVVPVPVGGGDSGVKNTVSVSPVGTDEENGTALRDALDAITDASDSNPYLVVIEPGVYDMGDSFLQMKEYVDVAGWGEDKVTIKGSIEGKNTGNTLTYGVVKAANHSELRGVTVQHAGGVNNPIAVFIKGPSISDFKMTHVTAEVSGADAEKNYGVFIYMNADPTLTNVTGKALGTGDATFNYGVYIESYCSPTLTDVTGRGQVRKVQLRCFHQRLLLTERNEPDGKGRDRGKFGRRRLRALCIQLSIDNGLREHRGDGGALQPMLTA